MPSLIPWTRREQAPQRVRRLRDEMDDLFGAMFAGLPTMFSEIEDQGWMPAVDVKDNDDHVVVTAELPGVDKKDVKIDVGDNALTLRGEKRQEKTEEKDNFWRREVSYGSFMRSIALPSAVDTSKADAKMENGVLTIRLPKIAEQKSKTIEVA